MKKLYSKIVETKVSQYLLCHKLVRQGGKISALARRESQLWKHALPLYPNQVSAYGNR